MTDDRSATAHHEPAVMAQLDRAFIRLRRIMVKPAVASLPLPSIGRPVDLAKIMACQAIADATAERADGQPSTVKDVAIALELDHSTASRLLGDAEVEGLVIRGTDQVDRRRTTVALTDIGRAVVTDGASLRGEVVGQILAEWNPDDVRALVGLLEKLADTFAERLPESIERALRRVRTALPDGRKPAQTAHIHPLGARNHLDSRS